jgi:hypothetical protein
MICKAFNPILFQAIQRIVKNTQTEFYGKDVLSPTGPNLFKEFMDKITIDKLELYNDDIPSFINKTYVVFRDSYILTHYDGYYNENNGSKKKGGTKPYYTLWKERKIYYTTYEMNCNRKFIQE